MRTAERNHIILHTKFLTFIFCLIFFSNNSKASKDSLRTINNLRIGIETHYGYVYPHHSSISYSIESPISSFELNLTTDTYGRSSWDKLYRYPKMGAGYLYTTLGNDKIYGRANAVFLFMDIPFSSRIKKINSSYRIGLGAAYLTRKFNVSENPMNMAISSGFNMYVNFRYNARYRVNERNEVAAGFGFTHFSNGKLATPNLGINCVTVYAGYLFNIVPDRYPRMVRAKETSLKKHNMELVFSGGAKTDDQITGNYYFISTMVIDYKFAPGLKYSFGAGLDLFYDESLGPNKTGDLGGTYTRTDLYQMGIHAGFYPRFSKLNIILQLGSYVVANYYKYIRVYSRIGFRYEIYNNILFNLSLKAHRATADYLEWGVGYRF